MPQAITLTTCSNGKICIYVFVFTIKLGLSIVNCQKKKTSLPNFIWLHTQSFFFLIRNARLMLLRVVSHVAGSKAIPKSEVRTVQEIQSTMRKALVSRVSRLLRSVILCNELQGIKVYIPTLRIPYKNQRMQGIQDLYTYTLDH